MSEEEEEDLGREALADDDIVLAAFFAGEDLSVAPVPDGGKGLVVGETGCRD